MKTFVTTRLVIGAVVLSVIAGCQQRSVNRNNIAEPDLFDTTARNIAPQPTVIMPKRFQEGEKITIEVKPNDVDSSKLTYLFDFDGDGSFDKVGEDKSVSHSWRQNGKYRVHVRVQDVNGAVGDAHINVEVLDRAPIADFKHSKRAGEGEWVTFEGDPSKSPSDSIVSYTWDFNYDGRKFNPRASGSRVEHLWKENGDYVVALQVKDSDGSTHLATKVVSIADRSPIPRIVGPKVTKVGNKAIFDGSGSRWIVDKIVSYSWDLNYSGAFVPSIEKSTKRISKVWKKPGLYRVALKVTDIDGSEAITTHSIRVEPKEVEPAKKK